MKTKFINIVLIGFCFILEFNGCKKDNPVTTTPNPQPTPCDTCLPAITTTGANTFGCRVNGKVWLPLGGSFYPGVWEEYTSNNHLIIHGYNDNSGEGMTLEVGPILDTGYFSFNNNSLNTQWGIYIIPNPKQITYKADTIKIGYLHLLRSDHVKGVFSGTFAFDLYDIYHQHNNDTIHITDGRFDSHL